MDAQNAVPAEAAHLGEVRAFYQHGEGYGFFIALSILGVIVGLAIASFAFTQGGVDRSLMCPAGLAVAALAGFYWFMLQSSRHDRTWLCSEGIAAERYYKLHTLRWEDIANVLYFAPSYRGDGPAAFKAAYHITRKDGSKFPVLSTHRGCFTLPQLKEIRNVMQDEIEKLPSPPVWEKKYLG